MIDFKDWSKVSEDKKTATFKHPKGHMMTVSLKSLPKIHQEAIKRIKLAEGTEQPLEGQAEVKASKLESQYAPEDAKAQASATPPPATNVIVNASPQPSAPPVAGSVVPTPVGVSEQTQFSPPLNNTPSVSVPAAPAVPNVVGPNGEMNAAGAAKLNEQGLNLQQQIDAEKGKQMANIQKGYLDRANEIQQTRNDNAQMLWRNQLDIVNAMKNGDINPNHYMENMGAARKVTSALGLFLGGMNGAGNNGAMDFLNKQIDRDIEAQKQNFEHKKTVFGAYQNLYGNNDVSANMARAASLDSLTHQADLITAQLATPQAAANNMLLKSKAIPERNKLILDAAGLLSSTPNAGVGGEKQASAGGSKAGTASEFVKHRLDQQKSEMGAQGAEASVPSGKDAIEPDDYADTPILKPNAKIWEAAPADLKQQFTQAQQADQILSQLHSVHQSLARDTRNKEYSYARRHNPLQGVPFVGEALSHALLQPISDNPTNRDYQANRTRIVSDVANAVGPNVPGAEIERMVDDNLPEVHDSPRMVAQKERNIRVFIKNHVPKSMLKTWKQSD